MRSTGRDGRALADWHRGGMEEPKRIDGYYLSQDERLPRDQMPGRLRAVEGAGSGATSRGGPGRAGSPTAPGRPPTSAGPGSATRWR